MKSLTGIDRFEEIKPYISHIVKYDGFIDGFRLFLKNGYSISVVKGQYTYSRKDSVELAVFTPKDEWYWEDKVKGYVKEDEFISIVKEIAILKTELTQGATLLNKETTK